MNQAVLEKIELDQKINELKDQLNKQTGKNYDKSMISQVFLNEIKKSKINFKHNESFC